MGSSSVFRDFGGRKASDADMATRLPSGLTFTITSYVLLLWRISGDIRGLDSQLVLNQREEVSGHSSLGRLTRTRSPYLARQTSVCHQVQAELSETRASAVSTESRRQVELMRIAPKPASYVIVLGRIYDRPQCFAKCRSVSSNCSSR